jgi:phage gpG-like protein
MEPAQYIFQLERQFRSVYLRLPILLGNEAVNFTLDNFRLQGFMGHTFQRWLPVRQSRWGKKRSTGRSILIGTGRLRRSIRIIQVNADSVTIGSAVKYARAHNEGLRLGVIQSVKSFTRKDGSNVSAHARRINQNIPRRQYMGNSPYLNARLRRIAVAEFMRENRFIKP